MVKSVLIVEDDPDGQEILGRMLFRAEIPVELTGTAEDALQLLSAEDHCAIVIDLALPGMDGFALLQQIRANPQFNEFPCIAITAFHTPTLKQRVMRDGFDGYFAKPLDDRRLIEKLNQILKTPNNR
ncbi:MAG: response regulator [Aggregatilineales bacterium]